MVRSLVRLVPVIALLVLMGVQDGSAQAQVSELASQRLGPGYMNMFLAYAAAWLLVIGWVVSIARRLASVERRLQD